MIAAKPKLPEGQQTLQDAVMNTIGDLPVLTARECALHLGWTFDEDGSLMSNIKCCGQLVKLGGWVGVEHAQCCTCGKGMQDLFGILPGPGQGSTAGLWFDCEKYPAESENHKHWIPKTAWDLKASQDRGTNHA